VSNDLMNDIVVLMFIFWMIPATMWVLVRLMGLK